MNGTQVPTAVPCPAGDLGGLAIPFSKPFTAPFVTWPSCSAKAASYVCFRFLLLGRPVLAVFSILLFAFLLKPPAGAAALGCSWNPLCGLPEKAVSKSSIYPGIMMRFAHLGLSSSSLSGAFWLRAVDSLHIEGSDLDTAFLLQTASQLGHVADKDLVVLYYVPNFSVPVACSSFLFAKSAVYAPGEVRGVDGVIDRENESRESEADTF